MILPEYIKAKYWLKSYPRDLAPEVFIPRVSLAEFVDEGMRNNLYRVAMVYSGREIRYKEEFQRKMQEEEIISWTRDRLAAYKYPRFIEFRREIPKSAVGKILRWILRGEELKREKKTAD